MDTLGLFLAVVLAGLSLLLGVIGILASSRYEDRRILFISGAFLAIGVVGALAVFSDLSPEYGGPFGVESIPLFVMVVAVGLLYVAMVRSGPSPVGKPHG